jgi:hypothetical protein
MAKNLAGIPRVSFASHNDASPVYAVGTVVRDDATNKVYKYVQIEDAAVAIGDVVEYSDVTGNEVTKDRAAGSSLGRVVAGVAIGTITDAYYGFIQVAGLTTYTKTDGSVAVGDPLVPHASADGQADTAAAGSTVTNTEGQVFGYALVADTTSACSAVMLRCAY